MRTDDLARLRPNRPLMAGSRGRPLLAEVVRTELKRTILGGEFAVGSKLPNEDRLCERFGVSRVTIREAVRGLIEDGLVVRKHGSGTYVTRHPLLRNSLDTNFSYTDYIEASGLRAGRQLIGSRTIAASEETAAALGIEVGAGVVEVRRIRTADRRPAIYSIDQVPAELIDPGLDKDALAGSLYRILTAADHPIAHAEAMLSPTVADRELARLLDVVPGTPLQFLRQIDYDESGRAVMVSDEWHVPSVMELRVYRRGPGPVS
jgi:GntR family transcriptional regulator